MALTLRRSKGAGTPLTHDEGDDNWAGEINQVGHGMAVGDLVYRDSPTTFAKAMADSASTLAEGIVVDVEDADNYSVATLQGTVIAWTHGLPAPPQEAYLSATVPGAATLTKPGGANYIQPVGRTWSTTEFKFALGPWQEAG